MLRERREEGKEMIGIIKSSRGNPDPPEVRIPAAPFSVGLAEDAAQVTVEVSAATHRVTQHRQTAGV